MTRTTAPRALVLDADRDNANSMAHLLRLNGCVTQVAYRLEVAAWVASVFAPDAIVADVGWGGHDGQSLPVQLPATARRTLLVALSCHDSEALKASCAAAGFRHFYRKPVEAAELLAGLGLGCVATA